MADKLAHYELSAPLGAGGMGEVFRARDTRLDRDVAVKILPESMARDPERIARFDREAKTLASLQHANIATVHDFMTVDGTSFLVMELVEGEDLSTRLERGPLEVDEARQLAIQLAAGLEAAHERNIVHRDLKPANIKITPEGQVKILDFGLARAVTGDAEDGSDPMLSPTITQAMTQAGTILGTAAYMSPEQARGKSVDKRADIWAFGVLLYEMLTGERLFEGETTSDTLASVLKNPVDFERLGATAPHDITWVLQRCLDRNPTRRLRDIGEARLVLTGESTISQMGIPAASGPEPGKSNRLWPVLCGLLLVGLVLSFLLRPAGEDAPLIRAAVQLPEGVSLAVNSRQPGPPMISPDGRALVFAAQDTEGRIALWHRRIDQVDARKLEGTDGGSYPFWSPDSRSIGFYNDYNLLRLDIGSGSPLRLAATQFGKGGSWSKDGTIVYASSYNSTLFRISAGGGDSPRAVTAFDSLAGDNSHRHPFFLPDQRHFLYLARGAQDSSGAVANSVRVGSVEGGVQVYVTGADGHAEFHDGRIVFARDRALVAQIFEPVKFELAGDPQVILPGIESLGAAARTLVSISRTGMAVYVRPGAAEGEDYVTVYDRKGNPVQVIGEAGEIDTVVVSPDRRRAAVVHGTGVPQDSRIWILDLERGTQSRFATGGDGTRAPVWSPDGRYLAYSQAGTRGSAIMARRVDGGGAPIEIFAEDNLQLQPESWSPSGRYLTFTRAFRGVSLIELDAEVRAVGEPRELITTDQSTAWGSQFIGSDDWVVYHSSGPGRFELFVVHTTDPSRQFQITSGGAIFPSYNPVTGEVGSAQTGTEVFQTMSVRVGEEGADPMFGAPSILFALPTRSLDDKVDFYGDEITLGSPTASRTATLPMLISDWRTLLRD